MMLLRLLSLFPTIRKCKLIRYDVLPMLISIALCMSYIQVGDVDVCFLFISYAD